MHFLERSPLTSISIIEYIWLYQKRPKILQFSNKDHLNPRRTVMCYPRKSGFLCMHYVLFNQVIMIIIQLWQHYTKIKMRRTDSVVSAEKSWGQAWTLYALVTTRSLSPPVGASFLSTSFSLFFLFLHKTNYILDLSHICSTGRIL